MESINPNLATNTGQAVGSFAGLFGEKPYRTSPQHDFEVSGKSYNYNKQIMVQRDGETPVFQTAVRGSEYGAAMSCDPTGPYQTFIGYQQTIDHGGGQDEEPVYDTDYDEGD